MGEKGLNVISLQGEISPFQQALAWTGGGG